MEMVSLPNASTIVGMMVALLVMAYTLPVAISELSNTSVGSGAAGSLWAILPLLAVVVVVMWLVRAVG
ncbi:MAG: hypothetical protein ABIK73_08680 [candidate division WOR-3 bacterium]